jgi:hypothetical protein
MPYTTALKDIPRLPSQAAKIANDDGTPTPEFYSWMTRISALLETYEAALDQVEP